MSQPIPVTKQETDVWRQWLRALLTERDDDDDEGASVDSSPRLQKRLEKIYLAMEYRRQDALTILSDPNLAAGQRATAVFNYQFLTTLHGLVWETNEALKHVDSLLESADSLIYLLQLSQTSLARPVEAGQG